MARGDFKRRMEASQRQMLEWARGRNGADELSGACTNVAVALVIVDLFAHTTWLSILALVLLGYSWFRITSKRVGPVASRTPVCSRQPVPSCLFLPILWARCARPAPTCT